MRQYVAQCDFDNDGILCISGKDFKYLKNVLRIVVGDMINVRTREGKLVNSTVCKIDEGTKKIYLQICASTFSANGENILTVDNAIEWILFMFVPKSAKFDLIVRQATECGISKIYPVASEYSHEGAKKMNFRGERIERVIREARQQSGSAVETVVKDCIDLRQLCTIWQGFDSDEKFGCVLYERDENTLTIFDALQSVKDIKKIKKCAIVCGAEGGISVDEIKMLSESGFVPVHFETNILRCETAALYGIASLQSVVYGLGGKNGNDKS